LATLIGLLASTGLRSGEALRLDRADVDLAGDALTIRKTKFRKDRLVPVHATTRGALRQYAHDRDAAFSTPKDCAFFLSSRGNRLSSPGLHIAFADIRKLAGLDDGKPVRPHDLRRRFAVTRLALWHQQRADVQALLPLLATYLGHASYSDTAYYVTGTADPARDERVLRIVRKVVRGLCHHHGLISPVGDDQVVADIPRFEIPPAFQNEMVVAHAEADILVYRYSLVDDPHMHSGWVLNFFERTPFFCIVFRSSAARRLAEVEALRSGSDAA